ncbi:integrin alpha-4 [Thalassophryne amazonica]|uniref:integrin alpha-4 n=1 Tax=Thalassophryne amazonica TaxID=390379 RepID=UPI00147141E7|nr:integrin alpha-4 [Thalassophryne amazonica]
MESGGACIETTASVHLHGFGSNRIINVMCSSGLWQNRSLEMILNAGLIVVLLLFDGAASYSVDQEHSLEFSGPSKSMFGYSVALHRHGAQTWLVVGAPVANKSFSPLARSPGAVYRCRITAERQTCQDMHPDVHSCGMTCEAERDDQWLGVSLSRQDGNRGGHILVCAHRWKNVFYSSKDHQSSKLPHGICYHYGPELQDPHHIIPCYRDHHKKFGEDYGSCQAGVSTFLTEDLIIMGAPGTSYWTGSVLVFNTSSRVMSAYLDDDSGAVSFGSYLGYSVAAGHFLNRSTLEVVGGAPQFSQKGKVLVFSMDKNRLHVVSALSGKQMGSYFGSSLCAVDLNADGLSDLLVGAPMTTSFSREEGRVHVYINQGEAHLLEVEYQLTGSDAYAARFGESVVDLGDLDDDGYHDVAIGAPQEDDLKGAIYIYNGRKEGISPRPSQRITGSSLGRDLKMFGQSLSSGIDVDANGYQDVAVGAFLSDSAVVLRSRPVVRVESSLIVPEQIDHQVAQCQEHGSPTVCFNVTICISVISRQYRGVTDLQYRLTSDLLRKPSFPPRIYFHGNGSSYSTRGRVRTRQGQLTCTTHLTYLRNDVQDIFTPLQFEVSYSLREPSTHRTTPTTFPPLKPILQQSGDARNIITNQTQFFRVCSLRNCSTDMKLSAHLLLPHGRQYFALGSGHTFLIHAVLQNAGDHALLPRVMLRFPSNIHYIKVLQSEEGLVSCDVMPDVLMNMVVVDCVVSRLVLAANTQVNMSFLLDVNQNSTPGDIIISAHASSNNYESEEYLHDNHLTLLLPLRYGVDVNIHGFVSLSSFMFSDEDSSPVDCYSERLNYTYKVLNSGPSRSLDTVVEIYLPKMVWPHTHRLLRLHDWQSSVGLCSISDTTVSVMDDCDVPQASFIKRLFFFFSSSSTRRLFCGRADELCEWLVCRLGNLEAGREVTIQLEVGVNPAVLLQAPGRRAVMLLESSAVMSFPTNDPLTTIIQKPSAATVVVEARVTQKPSASVKIFMIVLSLVLGLLILAALVWCLWKAGFFKRDFQAKDEDFSRDSWDYVPKHQRTESTS